MGSKYEIQDGIKINCNKLKSQTAVVISKLNDLYIVTEWKQLNLHHSTDLGMLYKVSSEFTLISVLLEYE